MTVKFLSQIKTIFKEVSFNQNIHYSYIALGVVAAIGHILFGLYWTYFDPQIYESFYLRAFGILTCVILLSTLNWNQTFQKFIPAYWIFAVTYNLPFFFTVSLIRNEFSNIWFVAEAVMIFTVILLVIKIVESILIIVSGILFAIIFCLITAPDLVYFNHEILKHVPIYLLTFVASCIFSHSNNKGMEARRAREYLKDKAEALQNMSATIAHELRNPLGAISLTANRLSSITDQIKDEEVRKSTNEVKVAITDSVETANNIINVVLADLSEKPILPSDFSLLSTDKILSEIVGKFGYRSEEQRSKVRVDLKDNFIFRAIPERFTFIMYNLLKNALYYLKDYPDSVVTVGAETKNVDGSEYNVIYVHDTGPGIPPEIIPKLFGSFFTAGKKEGTGIGLAFCKRNMEIFDGKIIVESEFGGGEKNGWTKFSLLFSVLSNEEIARFEVESKRKRILFVDDQKTNLLMTKSKIENAFPDIICDIADNGFKAIEMAKEQEYHLILMDIQMPNMDGIVLTGEIRNIDREVPVVAFTSLDKKDFLKETGKDSISESNFNYFLNKPSTDNFLYRTVTKWLVDLEDDFSYLGNKDEYTQILKGKKAILADDQETNLMMTKILLEKTYGMIVEKARDGKELLEIYKKSLDENGKTDFDIILTDINMPPHNGDEAAKEIRRIESANNISHKNEIPIIALSGEGQRNEIHHFFDCQMTDYFIKGKNAEVLFKMIAHYLIKKDVENEDLANENQQNQAQTKPKEQKEIKKEEPKNNLKPEDFNAKFKTFDPHYFRHFNQEESHEILGLFLKNSTESMSKIRESAWKNDLTELLLKIHALKGASGIIGTERLHNYLMMIETLLKNSENVSNQDSWLKELEIIYDEAAKEIKKVLDK